MSVAQGLIFYTDQEVQEFDKSYFRIGRSVPRVGLNNGVNLKEIQKVRSLYVAGLRLDELLFIGRLTEKSMIILLFEAMNNLGDDCPSIHIIGDGPTRSFLESECVRRGLEHKVFWHGSLVLQSEIARIANRCKAFVYPGEVGLSLIHAMAFGLPVIVHSDRYKHMPEIAAFNDAVNGWSFNYSDAKSLAQTILTALSNEEILNARSKAARETIGPAFTTEDMANRFLKFIYKVAKTR